MDLPVNDDTICAIATPVGSGGIGIIKISGSQALAVAERLFRPRRSVSLLLSHRLYYGWILDPASREPVDEVLLSYMAAPHSYTTEDVVEINCHSGYLVLNQILQAVVQCGARLAEPGEFTRRAFLHGRLDLSQAEAVLEIIQARSQQSLTLANRSLRGGLSAKVLPWHQHLLQLETGLEAAIEFSDELEEMPEAAAPSVENLRRELIEPLRELLQRFESSRILREGLALALVGKPNVGKSSLFNALLGKDRAIVTPIPGTTRDVIEDSFLLSGVLVRVSDTAGIRLQPDAIESLGITRSCQSAAEAHGVLWLIDQSRPLDREDDHVEQALGGCRRLIVLNKADLPAQVSPEQIRRRYGSDVPLIRLSVFNARDLERLQRFLQEHFLQQPLAADQSGLIFNLRQQGCLERALEALQRAEQLLLGQDYAELVSFELRAARHELDGLLGKALEDDLLEQIFSQFCIGK